MNSGISLNHLAISCSSELILHLHSSGDGGGDGVYGRGGGVGSSWCSMRMLPTLSVHQPAETLEPHGLNRGDELL